MRPASLAGMSTRFDKCAPTATKTASNLPSSPFRDEVLDPVPAAHPHAERLDPLELPGEDVAWQPVCGDAVPHHPAGLGARVANLHLVPEPREVIGGREPTRAGPDHEHPPAATDRRSIEEPALLQREVAQEPLDRVDRHGAIELGAVDMLSQGW